MPGPVGPKLLTDDRNRAMARRMRDQHWAFMEKVASLAPDPLWWCIWNKNRHHQGKEAPNQYWSGLIDGMELNEWMHLHRDWWARGEWDASQYAFPVRLTDAGRAAIANRAPYDMEPVTGGLVEPGWEATPLPPEAKCSTG